MCFDIVSLRDLLHLGILVRDKRGDSVLKVLVGLPLLFPCNFTSLFNSFSKGPGRLARFNDRARCISTRPRSRMGASSREIFVLDGDLPIGFSIARTKRTHWGTGRKRVG